MFRRLLLFFVVLPVVIINGATETYIRFDLIRDQHSYASHPVQLARNDVIRQAVISRRLSRIRTPMNSSFDMLINSGAFSGTGQYFALVQVGTPARPFVLVIDTGSDLTWIKCKNTTSPETEPVGHRFDARKSRTFRPITCSSPLCKMDLPFSLTECTEPTNPCLYDYVYADGSKALGHFATEGMTINLSTGKRAKLRGIKIGCTSVSAGTAFAKADGVLGLGYSKTSFAASATHLFGGKFSYCLVDHLSPRTETNYLVFGNRSSEDTTALTYVDLSMEPPLAPFYSIQVQGISVGEVLLDIKEKTWKPRSGGGVIVDSGTSLTVLTRYAYKAVTKAYDDVLVNVEKVEVEPFEFCYNWTTPPAVVIPPFSIHFAGVGGVGTVKFTPPEKSYIISVADGVKCLGFMETPWPASSTIGNIMQQNHLWEFDVANRKLGFKPSPCSKK
ncbi:Eukaryotic aspartyl protease family protein [Zostera marina]|uniref:Eukaryotic aspartyl protease family protein n=1 Tax=Zostera marina TaxID=29655 RepID=A0A0K9NJI7_ZOSMR|nr:Eukaryotic aspartyl protease family protein [Zostera marina]